MLVKIMPQTTVKIEPRSCPVCGKVFTPRKSQLQCGGGKHCSLACLGISRRRSDYVIPLLNFTSRECAECGSTFFGKRAKLCRACIVKKAGIAARKKHSMVGTNSPFWKGGVVINSEWWRKWRHQYRLRTLSKCKARDAARYAIKTGNLTKMPCEDCGSTDTIHTHHEDYARPLDVTWLCRECHLKRHGKLKVGSRRRAYLARKAKEIACA